MGEMQAKTDAQLLREYAEHDSEDAFREIAVRHTDLVYSSALRRVNSPDLARDVAQEVFRDLAHKARPLADKLTAGASLVGWLYRSTRFAALTHLRGDRRRLMHERQAMQLLCTSETAPDWDIVRPVLDEAMDNLSDDDRDALLLRYFRNYDFRAVGLALGVSDDAAQKRVSRAVERLREFFAKRGVTVGASGLVLVISANAVQPAPIGLSAAVAATATAAATDFNAVLLQVMTTTKAKLIAAAFIAALSIPLALLWHQNASLRREVAALGASRPAEPGTKLGKFEITNDERQRFRLEHLELLSLRGRATQLANELRQSKAAATTGGTSLSPASEPTETDSILFSAALTNRVGSGHTLVVGGWSRDGMRGYVLITPVLSPRGDTPDSQQLNVESQVVGAPESFWNQIGWGAARSDTRRSALAGVLSPEQRQTLLEALMETKSAEVSNTSRTAGHDGERMAFGFSQDDDRGDGVLMGIDLYPRIAPDGLFVDLELSPSAVSTNSVHSSLKPPQEPALPPAR